MKHQGDEKRGIIVVAYEHEPPQVDVSLLVSAFEILSRQLLDLPLGDRHTSTVEACIHPIHQRDYLRMATSVAFTMNSERYMKIVVDIFLFLELMGDDAIDADTAIQMMESIAADLDQLDLDSKRRFKEYLAGRAFAAKSEHEAETIEALSDASSDAKDGPSASVRDSRDNEMTIYSQIIVDSLLLLRLNEEPFVRTTTADQMIDSIRKDMHRLDDAEIRRLSQAFERRAAEAHFEGERSAIQTFARGLFDDNA